MQPQPLARPLPKPPLPKWPIRPRTRPQHSRWCDRQSQRRRTASSGASSGAGWGRRAAGCACGPVRVDLAVHQHVRLVCDDITELARGDTQVVQLEPVLGPVERVVEVMPRKKRRRFSVCFLSAKLISPSRPWSKVSPRWFRTTQSSYACPSAGTQLKGQFTKLFNCGGGEGKAMAKTNVNDKDSASVSLRSDGSERLI